ncbi:O-antigen ligase family protein [Aeromonas veronii]|uniref:O-antigen ligase family protein n=1 Tax=Aeromonas veronii TaxID=654 RepID=UPI003006EB62
MLKWNYHLKYKSFFLLNVVIFVFCLRPPGMTFIIIIVTALALLNMLFNGFFITYDKKLIPLYCFIFYMTMRCIVGFAFNGGYEERYLPVLLLFSCALIIHSFVAKESELTDIYSSIYYAIVITLVIVGVEMLFGYHLPTSRYSDPDNDAQFWSVSKPTAFYYNENDMLSFVVCFLPIAVHQSKYILIKIAMLLVTIISAVYIGSKAAILALLVYILFTKVFSRKTIVLIILLGVISILLVAPNSIDTILIVNNSLSRIVGFWDSITTSHYVGDESTSERLLIYKANLNWLLEHPLSLFFGNGRFADYESEIINIYGLRMGEFHNLHLEMITIYGLFFWLSFYAFYVFLLYKIFKLSRSSSGVKPLFLSALMYPILVSFGPSSSLKYPFLFILVFFMAIAVKHNEKKYESDI